MGRKKLFNVLSIVTAMVIGSVVGVVAVAAWSMLTMPPTAGAYSVEQIAPLAPNAAPGTISYQGRLTQSGNPVADANYNLTFRLYSVPAGGSAIWTEAQSVTTSGGLFTTMLGSSTPLTTSLFTSGQAEYLGITMGANSEMVPRQPLSSVPYALAAESVSYARLAMVTAAGGSYNSIQAALNDRAAWCGTPSSSNRCLLKVGPGTYAERVTMVQYVDIEGSGELTTKITAPGNQFPNNSATVLGANNAELRYLTVENTGGTPVAVGVSNIATAPRLLHVTIVVSGGAFESYGVYNVNSPAAVVMENVHITASAAGQGTGFGVNSTNGTVEMTGVQIAASGGWYSVGINSSGPITLTNVTSSASGSVRTTTGAYIISSSPTLNNVQLSAGGGTIANDGLKLLDASPTIRNSVITSADAPSYGIISGSTSGSHTITIDSSTISGTSATIYNTGNYVVRNGSSRLVGGPVSAGGGTISCANSHDGNNQLLNSSCLPDQGLDNVVTVAKAGGDFTTVSAALNSITDASDANRYLVRVAPGIYTETVTMKAYVDIEGSGEENTTISQVGNAAFNIPTVRGAANTELRSIHVRNTGGAAFARAIYTTQGPMHLLHVKLTATGGTTESTGLVTDGASSVSLNDVSVTTSGPGEQVYGVWFFNSPSPIMANVTISASNGLTNTFGMQITNHSPTLDDVSISSSSSSGSSRGIHNNQGTPIIRDSVIVAGQTGIHNTAAGGSFTVTVENSSITAPTTTIRNDAEFTTLVAASRLDGGNVNANGGTVKCAGVYDETYTFSTGPTCP